MEASEVVRHADQVQATETEKNSAGKEQVKVTPISPAKSGLYATPEEALEKVSDDFGYWTGRLTETSLQMCYAVIAADWLVFGSVQGILSSLCAKLSLLMVLLALASSVIGAWVLAESMRKRIDYGESDEQRWTREFNDSVGKRVAWPFTDFMISAGIWTRRIKGGFTLLGGIFLVVGAILKR